jgi:hypothetical protein
MKTKMGLITNDWDRDNLNFLLNTKGDDFQAFWAQADEDDRVYAQELLDAYSLELKVRARELEIEAQMELVGTQEANVVIRGVLDKFKK